jgi:signal transduction histidine kinase
MKISFTSKLRVVLLVLFALSLIQGLIILNLISNAVNINSLIIDIQNTVIITIFFQFVIVIALIFYIPVFLHKAFTDIHMILKDITKGIYTIDIDLKEYQQKRDKEFFAVILAIKEMLKSVKTFDQLKKEKIIEHHNRILSILNLTENGFLILDMKGNIVYINDLVTDSFKSLQETTNILETNFPPEVENNIKKYIAEILKSETKLDTRHFFANSIKRHLNLSCAIVRGSGGEAKGAVISISNLGKKKPDKNKDQEE